ncbi:hypothetical protein Cni_G19007 [Canna indica]|uniref:Agenet domain-containing protein n=1 Tax=Canna indica TaxID=4628 RepID=A0AAQ3KNQ8_9LILI|nr:hypothetical protein Cni_G19007 [Canna indica]
MRPPDGFRTRDEVEVSSDEDGFRGAYFEARVVRSMPRLRCYTVDYDGLVDDSDHSRRHRETVEARHVRPRPPRHLAGVGRGIVLHQPVDALYNDAWWVGVVSATPKGKSTKYSVCFPASREVIQYRVDQLRPHLEWVNGEWVLPESMDIPETPYDVRMLVEVANIKENSVGAWSRAVVVKKIWKTWFLVEYVNLKKDSKMLLREIIDMQHIRPCPLNASIDKFDHSGENEGFNGNGWCTGLLSKVDHKFFCTVKSTHQHKQKEYHSKLLLQYESVDSVNGQVISNLQDMLATDIGQGATVEVSSDEEGFSGAWFTATVLKLIGKEKFLVQYRDLKTDDETELLTETVDHLHIRPAPPEIPPVGKFTYLEEVDALYNDGWWVGVIAKVLKHGRYIVYFRTTNEEMEFGHDELRLHQDFINGKWVRPSLEYL